MADAESRSESPLSDIGSDTFTEDKFHRSRSQSNASDMSDESDASATPSTSTPRNLDARPAKRRKIGLSDYDGATPRSTALIIPGSPSGSISSDTSGSVPTSPSFAHLGPTHPLSTAYAAAQANPNDPESADYTQVTRCQWTNCAEPEQGNMDNLVQHINDAHIPPRQKKYFCEWEGCTRKSMPHTSAYALKAHMRSHTKEKPFMCQVPECDRSFTRSDALAKHMRTVHETEALRPSDPVPRGHTGGISQTTSTNGNNSNGASLLGRKLKLTFKGNKSSFSGGTEPVEPKVEGGLPPLPTTATTVSASNPPKPAKLDATESFDPDLTYAIDMDSVPFNLPIDPSYYPSEIYADMDEYERNLPPSQYFRILRRQIRWATEEGNNLTKELGEMRAKTDDLRGNPVTRQVPSFKESEIGDLVRKEEWGVVEDLLDRILKAEYEVALGTVGNSKGAIVEGRAETALDNDTTNGDIFEKINKLPFWNDGEQEPVAVAKDMSTSS
ncbi:hypothetical protein H2198_009682 [Neophaeococcomyces mojaviensis]|uniref:Uncharacterized protein n=1 Tax=Neophaeococcomyces mojaviensis TaxID=3383035 RepID=A0ACC2ZTT6_9EURO|nr:hypothetical protein H2198_009682 [Knufia sp. JES_112]